MTPEEWRRLAERAYPTWGRGDLEGLLATVTPDIHYQPSGAFPDLTEPYEGHEGMRRFWDEMNEAWARFEIELVDLEVHAEDLALIDIRFYGVGMDSGAEVTLPFFHVARARGELIRELHAYSSREAALEAHGLTAR